ncbi:MAG: CAP domain-containing protein [Caldimonas sp.]
MPTRMRFRTRPALCESTRSRRGGRSVALAIALALSTAAQSGVPVPCGVAVSPEEAARRLNDIRHHGVACPSGATATPVTVAWNDRLASAAQVQAREMARLERMSHRDSQNRDLGERLRAVGYRFGTAVENVAVGFASIDDVVDAWLESDGHCENVMNAAVREFGLACIDTDSTGAPEERRYWALVLASPPRPR